MARPFGVQVVALLQAFNSLAYGLSVFTALDSRPAGYRGEGADIFGLVVMCAGLVVAAGLIGMYRWAWAAALLWLGAVMAIQFVGYFRVGDANFLVMALAAAQVFYLNVSRVQQAFLGPETDDLDEADQPA